MGGESKDTRGYSGHWSLPAEFKQRPAIAIIDDGLDVASIIETLVRANQLDYFVFVVTANSTISALTRELPQGVMVLDIRDTSNLRKSVEQVSRSLDIPGVLYYSSSDSEIDFSRCDEYIRNVDEYGTDAPTVRSDERTTADVLAAIPAYNEESTIGSVVATVKQYVDTVVVINDASTDDTATMAERAGATVIEHERNRGYGGTLKTAFAEADRRDADRLVVLDGDGQHDPDDVPKLLRKLRTGNANIVIGSRFHGSEELTAPLYRRVGLSVINALTNVSLGATHPRSWVSDTQSGFRAYDREAIQSLADDDGLGNGMSASIDIFYHAHDRNYSIEEVGTTIQYSGDETSTHNPVLHGFGLIWNIVRRSEFKRPFTFLGIPGLVTVFAGGGFGYWLSLNYFESGTLSLGLFLLFLACTVSGSVLVFTSIVLHSLRVFANERPSGTIRR